MRALRVLGEVRLIAAEDTRTTRKLLNRYHIKTPLTSFHQHNSRTKLPLLLETLTSRDVALVSEAGVPTISDPGQDLVQAVLAAGMSVVPVPGPSALTTALSVSGTPADRFRFLGFLPRRQRERRSLLHSMANENATIVCFEAPHRLRDTLEDMVSAWGSRQIAICRELTKRHEEVFRGSLCQALAQFTQPRGEFTLVVEGGSPSRESEDTSWVRAQLTRLKEKGAKAREAVDTVAHASGVPKRQVYQEWLKLESGKDSRL